MSIEVSTIDETMSALSPQLNAINRNDEPPPRLLITKMELENFKSYAGVREIGPFHKSFSAVVGPNGSGKSNVIDAMLFVFGKRAKKLRLNKVSELIHKSDAVKDNPPTFARVSVFFQEIVDVSETDYRIVPDTETVITRVARLDNSSIYKFNGKNCQFREISSYLGSKGIDLDNNRFLILQGEVEMISMMPPKAKVEGDHEGLLEYLEDIIGSSKYVEETEKAAKRVEELSEVRQEKLNRVKAVEKEKNSLESAKLEAEALLGKEREIRRKQNLLYQIYGMKTDRELQTYQEKLHAVDAELEGEKTRLSAANDRVKEMEKQVAGKKKEHDKVFTELSKTKEEFAGYERRDIKLREEIKHAKAQKKKLQAKVKAEEAKERDAIAKKESAEESIPRSESRIQQLVHSKDEEDAQLEKVYDEMKGITQNLRVELEMKTQELAPIKQELAVFQAALDTATTEVKLLEDSTRRAKDRLVSAENELASLDEKRDTKRAEVTACQQELRQLHQQVNDAESEESALADKEIKLIQRHRDLVSKAEDAKAALLSKGESRSSAVKGILDATRKGGELSKVGILGRLGDLAVIADEYDVAVSTACGMLDFIVVQTTAGAQRCLEYLRTHNLGRANFIPLDKMKKGAHDRVVQTPEGAPRLFELITAGNSAIIPALFLAVGDTLVAPDLETATRWAYDSGKRWRVVTMDGKLIETSGTMSGGGTTVRRGGMRLATSRKTEQSLDDEESLDCQRLEQETASAQALLQECRQRRKELSEIIRTLKRRIRELELKLPKASIEIEGCETTRAELTKLIPSLRAETELTKEDSAKLVVLNEKVLQCKADMASCQQISSKLESEVAKLQKSILEAGGSKLRKQQDACEKAASDLMEEEKALSSAKVAVTSCAKAASKAADARQTAENQLLETEKIIEDKQSEFKALEEDAFKVMHSFEEIKKIELGLREQLDEISKEYDELKDSQSKVKYHELELVAKIDDLNSTIAELEKKSGKWNAELKKLRTTAEEEDLFDSSDDEEDEKQIDTLPAGIDQIGSTTDGSDIVMPETILKSSLPSYSYDALEKFSAKDVAAEIEILQGEKNSLAKNANMSAIEEYRKKESDYLARVAELDAITEERNQERKLHEDLRRQRLEMFMVGFGHITLKLKEMYQMITLGGDAELELVDSLDPFSEGIVFSVRPPKKSWKNISNLSGGEKTLSSLALVFALHHYKPTPLYVMDEIDAALDFKNVSIVANYIKERTKNAQFIIISLRNNMFELADRLVGIYKTNNCTKSVTIDPAAFGVQGQQNGYTATTPALGERSLNRESSLLETAKRRVSFHQATPLASTIA